MTTQDTENQNALTCAECESACDRLREGECCICRDTSTYSGMTMNGGMSYCDTCRERSNRQAERAHESFIENFYGGSRPVTFDEQHAAAWREKNR